MVNKKLKQEANVIIYCNECSHEFTLDDVKIKTDKKTVDNKQLIRKYFSCPKCKHKYTTIVQDKILKNFIKDYSKLVSKQARLLNRKADELDLRNNLVQMENLQEIIQEYQLELKRLWLLNE